MSAMTPEIRPLFQYGLLASSVSRIIAIYENQAKYQLTEGNKKVLKKAIEYIDDILNSQSYLTGGKQAHTAPSGHGLKAWRQAVNTMEHSPQTNTSDQRIAYFSKIKKTLNEMVNKNKEDLIKDEITIANIFFGNVASQYLQETESKFRVEASSIPI